MNRFPGAFGLGIIAGMLCISGMAHAAITNADKQFLIEATQSDVNELKLSGLAERKASKPEVKAYARKMVTDHHALGKKMKPFAMAWSVTPPSTPDAEHRTEYRKLRKLSGADFDKAYMDVMDRDHNKALEAFTHEANVVTDPDFKSTVISEKSVIAADANMADDLKSKL